MFGWPGEGDEETGIAVSDFVIGFVVDVVIVNPPGAGLGVREFTLLRTADVASLNGDGTLSVKPVAATVNDSALLCNLFGVV